MKTSTIILLSVALLTAQHYLVYAADNSDLAKQRRILFDEHKLAELINAQQCIFGCANKTREERKSCNTACIIGDTSDEAKEAFVLLLLNPRNIYSFTLILAQFHNHHYRLPYNMREKIEHALIDHRRTARTSRKDLVKARTPENEEDINKEIKIYKDLEDCCNINLKLITCWDDMSDEEADKGYLPGDLIEERIKDRFYERLGWPLQESGKIATLEQLLNSHQKG